MLSDSDSETSDLHTLTINAHYAKAFEYKKEREELTKLKEKYGSDYSESGASDADDSEDSEDTEEDSDGEELTPAVGAAILRTLARIRKKDPVIYEGDRRVFEEEHTRTQDKAPVTKAKTREKSKPVTIREAALASALADADSDSRSPSPGPRPLTHAEEQALLRSETRAAFHGALDSGAQGDDDDLLVPRSRTRDEIELEEEEYKAFLEREVGKDLHDLITVDTNEAVRASEDVEIVGDGDKHHEGKTKGKKEREKERERNQVKDELQEKKAAKKRDKKSKEEAGQEFLMNYIFNRGWIDRSNRRVPTYNEIIESSSKKSKREPAKSQAYSDGANGADQDDDNDERDAHGATLSDENSFDDLADAFETSYNFRFEEPGSELIVSFPRNISSARRESTTRKDARTRKKKREESEKQALLELRREEIRRERALAEAAVAVEKPDDENASLTEKDTNNKKKSKKQQRKEELARLKALKANEVRRKLEMVSSEGGLGGIGDEALAHLDLDADWDPSKHDTQMAELYGGADDIADDGNVEKPIWDDDINIDHIVPSTNTKSKAELKKQKKKEKKTKKTDEDIGVDVDEMDADLDGGAGWDDGEEWRGTEEERKRKVDAYMDEVVNRLGFSGITSHMPTRFHYTSVAPENYGLSPAEVLLATDAELNSYVGLRKMAPYRIDNGGKSKKNWDPRRAQRLKKFRENMHSRVGSRYEAAWSPGVGINSKSRTAEVQGEKTKRKGKKERAKLKAAQGEHDGEANDVDDTGVQLDPEVAGESQKRKRDSDVSSHSPAPQLGEKDVEDGTQGKRRKRRHKKRSGGGGETDAIAVS